MDFLRRVKKVLWGDQASAFRAQKMNSSTTKDWLDYYDGRNEYCAPSANADLPKVSIIVLTYNNLDYTRICLKSIYCNTTYPNFQVVVVDNASTDGSQAWLSKFVVSHPDVKLILNKENLGFSGGNNLAAREAEGDFLVFLNNDTVVTKGWLERMLSYMRTDVSIGLLGPVTNSTGNEARILTNYNSPAEMEVFADKISMDMKGQAFDIRMLAFFCVMARRDEYLKMGGLDERFLVGMFEDDDLAVRYQQLGKRVVCADDVFIHHFQSVSFNKFDDEFYRRVFEENRRKYEEKWGREWEPYKMR